VRVATDIHFRVPVASGIEVIDRAVAPQGATGAETVPAPVARYSQRKKKRVPARSESRE